MKMLQVPVVKWSPASVGLLVVLLIIAQSLQITTAEFLRRKSALNVSATFLRLDHLNQTRIFASNRSNKLREARTQIKPNDDRFDVFGSFKSLRELPEISASVNADNDHYVRASEIVFYNKLEEMQKYTYSELVLMGIIALGHASVYNAHYLHRYDNFNDMKRALGPEVNNELCVRQLTDLDRRIKLQNREGFNSTDVNVYQIMDSWARMPPDFMLGDMFIEGSYRECLNHKLISEDGAGRQTSTGMHYCVLSVKSPDWPQVDKHDVLDLKAGICIPKTCDSSNYKNKYELLRSIAASQLRPMDKNDFHIGSVYCLPDKHSPLRSIRHSLKTRLVATCFILWIAYLVLATYKHNKLRQIVKQIKASASPADSKQELVDFYERRLRPLRMLSVTNNLRLLFNTTKESSLLSSASASSEKQQNGMDIGEGGEQRADRAKFVNLSCIEGIKVIAMCYIIMGHVVMCMPTIMNNGRDLAEQGARSLAFFIANLVPAFAVNSFFCITGILTCYLMFKQNHSQQIITSPGKWLAMIVYRYLRIMPMYALAVLYCKTLAKYTGDGPFWDYGTSSLSQRRVCEQESWRWTLTFTSNFLPPMRHCIPGGWYLSNDMQFLLVTPLFLVALHLRPRLGKALLYAGIAAGYLAGFLSIYTSAVSDLRPIAQFMPYGFKTYVSHLSFNYTHPQYRIPAYLIGLLVGHELFQLEERRRRYNELGDTEKTRQAEPSWSERFKQYGVHLSSLIILICCVTPIIGRMLPFNKWFARFMVAFITPSYHLAFAIAIGMFLMLATTGHANKHLTRFLSSPRWKPFARLSLCAVLVNVEVINYIIQTHTRQQHISNGFLMILNATCIIATYVAATAVCVLFEAPVRACLNSALAGLMKKMARAPKQKT